MGLTNIQLPPPANWQDLERLARDLFSELWRDPHACQHGRHGQSQHGVDVYGWDGEGWSGVQCKGKDARLGVSLTLEELDAEVKKAQLFVPRLRSFTLLTTARRDQGVQEHARKLTEQHRVLGLFSVAVMAWEDMQAQLARYPDLIRTHYPQFFFDSSTEDASDNDVGVLGLPLSPRLLEDGAARYTQSIARLGVAVPRTASLEIGVWIPRVVGHVADRDFLYLVTRRNPTRWSGWTMWMDPQSLGATELQPYIQDDAWEARVILLDGDPRWSCQAMDFWRACASGRFYQRRALWEDGFMPVGRGSQPPPSRSQTVSADRELDPALQILHVAEALEAGLKLANRLQREPTTEKIDFSFRWSGLRDRVLVSRLRPAPYCSENLRCASDEVFEQRYIHASTDPSEFPRLAHELTAKLIRAFGGFRFELSNVESMVTEFLSLPRS